MKAPLFYQLLAGVLAILLALGASFAGVMIHNAQLEVEHFRKQDEDAKKQLDATKLQLDKYQNFLQRLETDPDFLDRVARGKLKDYAKQDDIVFRFDVDPLTGAPSSGNLDATHTPATTPSLRPPTATSAHRTTTSP